MVAVATAALLLVPLASAFAQTDRFDDVAEGAYYSRAVADLGKAGVFAGTECEEGFCPGTPIDRKTMAVWMVRMLEGQDPPTGRRPPFDDVNAGSFYAPFIARLAEVGITSGCGDGTRFCPDQHVTRAQMAVFLSRALRLPVPVHPWPECRDSSARPHCASRGLDFVAEFADVAPDAWYRTDVARLAASRITHGCGDGTRFCPDQDVTRAQMAVFLWRVDAPGNLAPGNPPFMPPIHRPIKGRWSVPVYICGPDGKYTADDVSDLTSRLNTDLNGVFERASSQRMSLVLEEGAVVTVDIDWEDVDNIRPIQRLCTSNALARSSTPQVLISIDTGYLWSSDRRVAGYGRFGGEAVVRRPNTLLSGLVMHELGHSILQLRHVKYTDGGPVFVSETLVDYPILDPILACYQYDQLGWPVPEYAQPCKGVTPSEPDYLRLWPTAQNEAILTWHPPTFSDTPVTGYTASISRVVEGVSEVVRTYELGAEARFHVFAKPELAGEYELSVRANNKHGPGDSKSLTAWLESAPPPPEDLGSDDTLTTTTSVSLSWDNSNTQPYVNVSTEVEYSGGDSTFITVGGWNGHHLTGLEPGTQYSIRVRSCSVGGVLLRDWKNCGEWGDTLTVETERELPPPDPIGVSAGRDWYLLTWEPVPGAITYQIELPGEVWASTYTPDFAQAHNVEPGTTYALKVRSCSRELFCYWGDWQEVSVSTTRHQVVPPPYQVSLKGVGDMWAEIGWETVSQGQGYRVEYEYTDGDTSSGLRQHGSPPLRLTVDSGKTYSLRLRNCPIGTQDVPCSSWTSIAFTAELLTSPVAPPMVEPGEIGDIWFDLSWDPVSEATSYDWRYKRAGENYWQWQGNASSASFSGSHSLMPSTAYVVEIRSCGEATKPCSDWASTTVSTVRSFPSAPPSFPVSVERVTDSEIFLTWDPPTRLHVFYDVRYYPTADRGSTSVRRIRSGADAVLSGLDADTAYTLQVSTCSVDADSGSITCGERVTIEASTRQRS